jgi:hypothetical protein
MLFGVVEELRQILGGELRVDQQHHRRGGGADDRRKVLHRVVGEVLQHRDVAGVGGVGAEDQRVAIGRTARDFLRSNAAERAGAVLDQHRLAPRILQMLAHQPRHIVRPGTGRKRHDDLDLSLGVRVCGECKIGSRPDKQHRQQRCAQPHQRPPVLVLIIRTFGNMRQISPIDQVQSSIETVIIYPYKWSRQRGTIRWLTSTISMRAA